MWKTRLLVVLSIVSCTTVAHAAEWVNLIDGNTLNGWTVESGFAKYEVQDGVIVGSTVEGSPNTFLCTEKEYGNFILEFDVMVDAGLNSGVQIRSKVAKEEVVFWLPGRDGKPRKRTQPAGRVYGYQVEIVNENLHNCGYIYDEARRGFYLDHDRDDTTIKTGFKVGQWNSYRVECKGNSIKTWINGVPSADLQDSMSEKGIIGLQVHGIRDFKLLQVRFRNIRIQEL